MAQAFGAVHHICTLGDAMCYAARQTGRRIHQRRKLYKASCYLMALQADAQQLAGALGYRMYRYQSGAIHAPKSEFERSLQGLYLKLDERQEQIKALKKQIAAYRRALCEDTATAHSTARVKNSSRIPF